MDAGQKKQHVVVQEKVGRKTLESEGEIAQNSTVRQECRDV